MAAVKRTLTTRGGGARAPVPAVAIWSPITLAACWRDHDTVHKESSAPGASRREDEASLSSGSRSADTSDASAEPERVVGHECAAGCCVAADSGNASTVWISSLNGWRHVDSALLRGTCTDHSAHLFLFQFSRARVAVLHSGRVDTRGR
jgi:hypothetical protein